MSRRASDETESFAGMLFEQALDFELGFCGTSQRCPQVKNGFSFRRSSLELGLDEHKSRAAQNAVDQKEILETVRVNCWNPSPLHSCLLPAACAKTAPGNRGINISYVSSELSPYPSKYGDLSAQVDPIYERFVPNHGTLSAANPYKSRTSRLHSGATL